MVLEHSAFAIKSRWGSLINHSVGNRPKEHFVQFYEDEALLCETVVKFVVDGLEKAEGIIVVATLSHLDFFERQLRERNVELDNRLSKGQILLLDADKMLEQFMLTNQPDAIRFQNLLGNLLAKMSLRYTRIRAFGEMVNLLCERNNFSGALTLEHLWNNLANKHHFSLLCGYDMSNFKDKFCHTSFRQVCHVHSQGTPTT